MVSGWRPRARYERGQAIVLVALMVGVLVGMAALAIDGSRAYTLRRDLQAAVDAAALAAGDNFQQTGNYASAEAAATNNFGANVRLYAAPGCAPAYAAPTAAPLIVICTYAADNTVLTQVISDLGPAGSQFALTAKRSLNLMFGRILTNGATPRLTATASGSVGNLLRAPTLAALNQAGCGGAGGVALSITGNSNFTILGDVVSAGAISVVGGSTQVAGDIYARCQASVSNTTNLCYPSGGSTPCTYPDVAGAVKAGSHFVDPNYPLPTVVGLSQGMPGTDPELKPGTYATDPGFPVGPKPACWFLRAGVYDWQSGYTNDSDLVSNELKPPDEPQFGSNTIRANPQFWDDSSIGVACSGAFQLRAVGAALPIAIGVWPIEVTSVRTDTYLGVNYKRESAPSVCRTVRINSNQVIQMKISNVPGATSYNVYAGNEDTGCGAPLGFVTSISVPAGTVKNDKVSSATPDCPSFTVGNCSLGIVSMNLNSTLLGLGFVLNPLGQPFTVGSPPPAREAAPLAGTQPNTSPDRAAPLGGDRANENQCQTVVAVLIKCPAAITPGAVEFYLPNGGCLNMTPNGDNYIFSGYQYDWLVVYEPGLGHLPANTCGNVYDAAFNSALIGLVYVPAAALFAPETLGFMEKATGGIIADTLHLDDIQRPINFSPDYAPIPPAARLVS